MQVEYRKNLNRNYIVIQAEKVEEKEYRLEMISQNHIKGLLPCHYQEVDGRLEIFYDITSKQPLSKILERKKLKETEYRMVVKTVLEVLERIKEYLLEEAALRLLLAITKRML